MKVMIALCLIIAAYPAAAKNTGVNGQTGIRIAPSSRETYPEYRAVNVKPTCRYRVSACRG